MANDLAFYFVGALTVACAVAAMALRQMVHCALCAAAAFAGLAVIYLQLDAEFVGFAQLLVYVGAIAILIVFAILLTRGDEMSPGGGPSAPSWLAGVAVALLVLGGIVLPVLSSPSLQRHAPPAVAAPARRIGEELMTRYVLPLETIGVLLTGALLGAVVLALREPAESGDQGRGKAPNPAPPEEAMSVR
jgi:NADH-quinone oxidoreductase subunit J